MSQSTQEAQVFLQKWRSRWPQWAIARVFVAPRQRAIAEAWFGLLSEWMDAALGGQDAAPGLAKLAWWQEELRGWARGAYRHPLGGVLQKQAANWEGMADALARLRHRDALRGERKDALAALQPFADAAAQVENGLWPEGDIASRELAHLLFAQAAAHGQDPASLVQAWSTDWPQVPTAAQARRVYAAFLRTMLRSAGYARPASDWRILWNAWKAARN